VTRRLHSGSIPWDPDTAERISILAADEAVFVLTTWVRVPGELDLRRKDERKLILEAIAAGKEMPSTTDVYPIGNASVPAVVDLSPGTRTTTADDGADFSTEGMF
jgi:hypothetical protein